MKLKQTRQALFCGFLIFVSLPGSFLSVATGEEGDTVGAIRPQVFPESLIPNGSIGLSCCVGE